MDYFLQKVCGKPALQAVTLRRCTPAEASAVFALQNEVRAAMPHPEQFVPDTLENITGYLRTGICIGAWQQRRLGATISPDNSYSLRNAQAGGFVIRCRREMYGGYDRYLLEKQL